MISSGKEIAELSAVFREVQLTLAATYKTKTSNTYHTYYTDTRGDIMGGKAVKLGKSSGKNRQKSPFPNYSRRR